MKKQNQLLVKYRLAASLRFWLLGRTAWAVRLFFIVPIMLVGCRSLPLPEPPVADVAVEREMRKAVAVEQFEQKRNFAEYQAALSAHDRGDLRASRDSLESLLRRNPQHRDARLLLATVQFEQKHPQESLAQLSTALADFPDDPDVHRAMSTILLEMGRPDEAWAYQDRAEKLAARQNERLPESPRVAEKAPNALAEFPQPQQGQNIPEFQTPGNMATTADTVPLQMSYNANTDGDGGNSHAISKEVSDLLRQGEQALSQQVPDRGLALFRQAAGREPHNPHIPTAAAIAALRQNRPDVAITVAQEALVAFPRWTPLLRTLGMAHYRQGDYQSSQLVLQQALSLDKSDWLAYFLLGCTYVKLEQFDAADTCFADAQRINPRLAARNTSDVHKTLR